jgi:hypothetical protein
LAHDPLVCPPPLAQPPPAPLSLSTIVRADKTTQTPKGGCEGVLLIHSPLVP